MSAPVLSKIASDPIVAAFFARGERDTGLEPALATPPRPRPFDDPSDADLEGAVEVAWDYVKAEASLPVQTVVNDASMALLGAAGYILTRCGRRPAAVFLRKIGERMLEEG